MLLSIKLTLRKHFNVEAHSPPILCPCFQLCANDILDGVDEFIESISLLPEPEKTLHPQDTDHQPSLSHGEEDGNVTDVLGEGPHYVFQAYIADPPELTLF